MNEKLFPICITVLWAIAFGFSMHNWTVGICMGIMMGIAYDVFG